MGIITLNSEDIIKLGVSATSGVRDEKAEEDFAKLLEIQDSIAKFVDEVKSRILEETLENDPNITAYQGKILKFEFRKYGSKYAIRKGMETEAVERGLAKVRKTISIDSKAVDEVVKEFGKTPDCIEEKDRSTTLTIKKV